MQAECSICMEHFESSAAISASRCGHVFHEACIARWLGESRHCPQCRTVVNKVCLTRLFFTDSSTSRATAVNHQRDIDKLQARIDKLTDDCQRKGETIEELTCDRRYKRNELILLKAEFRRKNAKIDELTYASEQKDVTIATLTKSNHERADLVVEQAARLNQLTKALEWESFIVLFVYILIY